LLTVESAASTQLPQRICHEPEASFAFICTRQIFKRGSVKQHRSKAFHSGLTRPRQLGIARALKQGDPESASIIDRKPIAIGASHRKQSLHRQTSILELTPA
jgi:hypothetical protein